MLPSKNPAAIYLPHKRRLVIVPCKIPCPLIPRIIDHPGYAGSPGFIDHQHTILESSLNRRPHFDFITTAKVKAYSHQFLNPLQSYLGEHNNEARNPLSG